MQQIGASRDAHILSDFHISSERLASFLKRDLSEGGRGCQTRDRCYLKSPLRIHKSPPYGCHYLERYRLAGFYPQADALFED